MKVLYDECIEALRDNKCSECNDFYQCSVCDYFQEKYQQGRADNLSEICKQISERVEYWDSCAKAVEKGSNEYKIFISLAKNFDELLEHIK